MRKVPRGKILNLLLWLNFCAVAGTGLLLAFRLPPGSRGGRSLLAMGLSRHEWGDFHLWLAVSLLLLLSLHLAAHWRRLWPWASGKRPWRLLLGIGLGLALLLALFLQPVSSRREGRRGKPPAEGRL